MTADTFTEHARALAIKDASIRQLQDEVRGYQSRLGALQAQYDSIANKYHAADAELSTASRRLDRYRSALQAIVDVTPADQHRKWPHHHHYLFVATEALKDGAVEKQWRKCAAPPCETLIESGTYCPDHRGYE